MNTNNALLEKVARNLPEKNRFKNELMEIEISLINARYLHGSEISWWRGKSISLIAIDSRDNKIVRHCSGKVLYLDEETQTAVEVANSVKDFLRSIY